MFLHLECFPFFKDFCPRPFTAFSRHQNFTLRQVHCENVYFVRSLSIYSEILDKLWLHNNEFSQRKNSFIVIAQEKSQWKCRGNFCFHSFTLNFPFFQTFQFLFSQSWIFSSTAFSCFVFLLSALRLSGTKKNHRGFVFVLMPLRCALGRMSRPRNFPQNQFHERFSTLTRRGWWCTDTVRLQVQNKIHLIN